MNELTSSLGRRLPSPRRHLLFVPPAHPICRAAAIYSFGRRIPFAMPPPSILSAGASLVAPPSILSAGASHCRAAISLIGRRIPLPHRNSYLGQRIVAPSYQFLAGTSPIAVPQSIISAGASNRRATTHYFSQRILLLRRHLFSRPAHPVAAPPYHILAGASNRRATTAYLGWRIPSPI